VPWQFIVVAGIVSFALGAVKTFYLPADLNAPPSSESPLTLVANTAAFLVASLIALYSSRTNPALAFYVAIPFVAVASILLAIPLDLAPVILIPTTSIGVDLIRLLVWLLLAKTVIGGRAPAAFCFGGLSFAQFAGSFFGQILAVASASNDLLLSFAVLICLLIATLVVVMARRLLGPVDQTETDRHRALRALGERHALSPREREVLAVWLSGHTSSHIEGRLHISKNTVKTHLSHIYAKTGTSNREELLGLFESLQ
jgi:DNA-binding CsgD family transcriptional regulator